MASVCLELALILASILHKSQSDFLHRPLPCPLSLITLFKPSSLVLQQLPFSACLVPSPAKSCFGLLILSRLGRNPKLSHTQTLPLGAERSHKHRGKPLRLSHLGMQELGKDKLTVEPCRTGGGQATARCQTRSAVSQPFSPSLSPAHHCAPLLSECHSYMVAMKCLESSPARRAFKRWSKWTDNAADCPVFLQ